MWLRKLSSIVVFVFVLVIGGLFSVTTVFPNEVMKWIRTDYFQNENVTLAKQKNTQLEDGTKVTRDVQYDKQDVNGYLDIYHTTKGNKNPETFVYIHGGGYIWGDKQGGDPTGGDATFKDSTIYRMLDAGYNVVSYNYALAPDVSFPTAILQLNRGLDFINQNATKYDLNMDKVILGGGSAGGNLAGVLTNIQTNPDYAKVMNTRPVLKKDQIKAVFFQGGAADNSKIGVTDSSIFDWLFYNVARVYLESNNLYESEFLTKSNVTDYVTSDFPPVFISDGNKGTPYGQNFVLYSKFQELGVESKLSYFHKEYAGPLGHGFDEFGGKYADISMENLIEFLQTNVREKS
ncbi:alpha/beta hydrolase [Mammaliicoccus vitulinus]|uniref:alpha/beta hydrolase n=1 Tax=Mammaliicoccus vitulinus TaxID=71237 RepID=UPI003B9F9D74